jgi:hypothetical protein
LFLQPLGLERRARYGRLGPKICTDYFLRARISARDATSPVSRTAARPLRPAAVTFSGFLGGARLFR